MLKVVKSQRRALSMPAIQRPTQASLRHTAPPPVLLPEQKASASPAHFYQNRTLDYYVEQRVTPITLRQLVFFGKRLNEERLIKSANYVRNELPVRLAHRIRDFQQLPFIVGTNPHIQLVYDLYWVAFEKFRKVSPIETAEDNQEYCNLLRSLLRDHLVVIPQLALGISECAQHIPEIHANHFMNTMLRSRISRRVITEQHLALTEGSQDLNNDPVRIGTIFTNCNPKSIIEKCIALIETRLHGKGKCPPIIIDGYSGCGDFTYISEHIEYIVFQLLSNSVRHTLQFHQSSSQPPPVKITVCSNNTDFLIRISDQGGGMSPETYRDLWSFTSQRRFKNFESIPKMAARIAEEEEVPWSWQGQEDEHLGIGLPMSKVYSEYWGGELKIMSMEGFGTEAYLRIPRLGNQTENIDFEEAEEVEYIPAWENEHRDMPIRHSSILGQ
ncbi:branched-chain alpha-ketoacid dehydrogenase kinase [Umbelopsis sp. PMI_123]|nr:branched-chain alpha-ketoacid dehydrogenase kinase [Umbelopsis sp. PMI_123]